MLKLADGRVVRLIGAKAPMPPLGFRGEDRGKQIELRYGGAKTDRHGYALAQVFVVDGASSFGSRRRGWGKGSPASIPSPTTALV
jgi:hypothetical protein